MFHFIRFRVPEVPSSVPFEVDGGRKQCQSSCRQRWRKPAVWGSVGVSSSIAPHYQVEGSWAPRSETVPSTTYSPGPAMAPWSRESSPSEFGNMMFPDFRFRAHRLSRGSERVPSFSQQRTVRCRDGADDLGRASPARLLGVEWI